MKKNLLVLVLLIITSTIVFRNSFSFFFAQDDFLLINEFSQNNFITDIKNTFGLPKITHWRPMHNLYFLVSGNLFGKNYSLYHLLTFILHISVAFLTYKIIEKNTKNSRLALAAAFIYSVHSAHFVTLCIKYTSVRPSGFSVCFIAQIAHLPSVSNIPKSFSEV